MTSTQHRSSSATRSRIQPHFSDLVPIWAEAGPNLAGHSPTLAEYRLSLTNLAISCMAQPKMQVFLNVSKMFASMCVLFLANSPKFPDMFRENGRHVTSDQISIPSFGCPSWGTFAFVAICPSSNQLDFPHRPMISWCFVLVAQVRPKTVGICPKSVTCCRNRPDLVEAGPNLFDLGTDTVDVDQVWSSSAQTWSKSAKVGRTRSKIARTRSRFGRASWPTSSHKCSAPCRPKLAITASPWLRALQNATD